MPENKQTNRIIFWVVFAAFMACFTFIYIEFPLIHDDWGFPSQLMYIGNDETGHHTLWDGLKGSIQSRYIKDNSRICNTIATILFLFPPIISKIIIIISLCIGLILMLKIIGVKETEPCKLILFCFLILFLVNWQEHMFSIIFAFNYIVVLPIFLGHCSFYLMLRKLIPCYPYY